MYWSFICTLDNYKQIFKKKKFNITEFKTFVFDIIVMNVQNEHAVF